MIKKLKFYDEETKYCKVCFKPIQRKTIFHKITKNICVCSSCLRKLEPKFRYFKVQKYKGLSLFDYDESLQGFIYQLKGCHDIELSEIFFERYKRELKILYFGYICIPAPSSAEDDNTRGFNHVVEIFNKLRLEIYPCVSKTEKYKQSDHNAEERANISKFLKIEENAHIKNKKILIVDDVYTTGSTVKSMIKLIEPFKPKKIKVFVLSKTRFKPKESLV